MFERQSKKKFSKPEIILCFRKYEIKSIVAFRKNKYCLPKRKNIEEEFGSIKKAIAASFPPEELGAFTKKYMISCGIMYGITSVSTYDSVRRSNPSVLPNKMVVYELFGSFVEYIRLIREKDPFYGMGVIFEMWRDKKTISLKSCKKRGIDLNVVLDAVGGRQQLYSTLRKIDKIGKFVILRKGLENEESGRDRGEACNSL